MTHSAEELRQVVGLRTGTTSDAPFILNSWLKSYWKTSSASKRVPGVVYWPMHEQLLKRILGHSLVLVAVATEAPDTILGWACVEDSAGQRTLHYLYVKQLYRDFGVESLLLDGLPGCRWYTHRTKRMDDVARRLNLTFNPYLAGVLP